MVNLSSKEIWELANMELDRRDRYLYAIHATKTFNWEKVIPHLNKMIESTEKENEHDESKKLNKLYRHLETFRKSR